MKLLLISDENMGVNQGGFSQTLYNVFSFMEPADFLFVTSGKRFLPAEPYTKRTIIYDLELIGFQRNRLGKYINKLIGWVNYSINYNIRRFEKIKKNIRDFNPDVVIIAPNQEEGVFMYFKLKPAFENKKIFPYLMDDWLRQSRLNWFGTNIHSLTKQLLEENSAWIMISSNLGNLLADRYKVKPARMLEIHNPVDISDPLILQPVEKKEAYTFVYAGSIWQMHFDSLLIMAKAIKMIKPARKLHLIIYTSQNHWDWRKDDLIPLGVEYGGFIPYKEIHQKLKAADFLLLTSTFTEDLFTHSKTSIQTKITDYLKAGSIIISCGPSYSVNHEFLKKYDCGICIETQNEQEVADFLNKILQNPGIYSNHITNGFSALMNEFSFEKTHQKLNCFLQAT